MYVFLLLLCQTHVLPAFCNHCFFCRGSNSILFNLKHDCANVLLPLFVLALAKLVVPNSCRTRVVDQCWSQVCSKLMLLRA